MPSYYLTAAIAFTLGFLAAAAFISGRGAQAGRERAWLAEEVAKFIAHCRSRPSEKSYLATEEDLQRLEEAAAVAKSQAE